MFILSLLLRKQIKIRLLAAHASLKCYTYAFLRRHQSEVRQEYASLLPLFAKNSRILGNYWIRILRDYSYISLYLHLKKNVSLKAISPFILLVSFYFFTIYNSRTFLNSYSLQNSLYLLFPSSGAHSLMDFNHHWFLLNWNPVSRKHGQLFCRHWLSMQFLKLMM